MAGNTTIFVHYAPPGAPKPVKLKLVLPPSKTVKAVVKAFAKAVFKSRPELPRIDLDGVAVRRRDGRAVDFEVSVGDAFAENDEVLVLPLDAVAPGGGGPCPEDGRPPSAAPGGNGAPTGAWLRVAGKGALLRAGPSKAAAEVATPLRRGAEAWGDVVEWLADGTPRVRLTWPTPGWATLSQFEPFRVPDKAKVALSAADIGCEPDDPGDWWAATKFLSSLNAMPRLPAAMEGEAAAWLERGDVALGAGYLADAVGRYSRAIVFAFRDQHVGKLRDADDYCVLYAMRALALWRARLLLPEADRDASLFGASCLCGAGRDVAFASAHSSKKKVEDWLGPDVVADILAAGKRRRIDVAEKADAGAKVPFGGIRVGKPEA